MERDHLFPRVGKARRTPFLVTVAGLASLALVALSFPRLAIPVNLLSLPLSLQPSNVAGQTPVKVHASKVEEVGSMAVLKDHILYSDWRGTSLEYVDSWSFSHRWAGSVSVQEQEQSVVKQPKLELSTRAQPPALDQTTRRLSSDYNIKLDGEWKAGQAAALLETLDDLCSKSVHAKNSPHENCAMQQPSTWKLHAGRLVDDVSDERSKDGSVKLAKRATDYGKSRGATLDANAGTVVSRRLQFAVMRVVTNFGENKKVVGQILKRRFGATLHVDQGYTKLTSVTTYEDGERFQHFKSPEVLFMLEAWSLMPPTMYNVAGLKYVTRRQQGLDHPLYGPTTAVSWPTNLDESYQEYMDYSFNNDGYTSRHLFIHEKTHFFWGRHWSDSLKQEWYDVGKWKDKDGSGHWGTPLTTAFSSDYGASNNPDEDLAECMAAYVLHPVLLQARAPEKAAFIAKNIARGVRHLERPEVILDVPNKSPYRRWPAMIQNVDIKITGAPEEDKAVDVTMLVDVGQGWHSPVHAEVNLAGPSGGSKSLTLYPDATAGGEEGIDGVVTLRATETFSKLYEKGFWSASQIKIKDKLGNERWVKVGEYSWRLYLNNAHGTAWPPRYLKNTLKLEKSVEFDPAELLKQYPVITATVRFQQTGAPVKEVDPVWMRLAAKPSSALAAWKEAGPSEYNYPIYQVGKCVKDENSWDGTCTVKWKLSPNTPRGSYYVAMMKLSDSVGNHREQFFTLQKEGWTCCGRVGNTPDDEKPVFVELDECAATSVQAGKAALASARAACATPDGCSEDLDEQVEQLAQAVEELEAREAASAPQEVCVQADVTPPQLDRESVTASMTPTDSLYCYKSTNTDSWNPQLDRDSVTASMTPTDSANPDGSGTISVKFLARDDKAGIGTVSYRVMDPQGFSHTGYLEHENQYGPLFHGNPSEWKEYTINMQLARGSPAGTWRLESLDLHDKAGNRKHHQFIELLVFSADEYS